MGAEGVRIQTLEVLAGMRLTPEERAAVAMDLKQFLHILDSLQPLEAEGDAALRGGTGNRMRPDRVMVSLPPEAGTLTVPGVPAGEGGV